MSAQRFAEWRVYEQLEPFGERGHYWRTGQICAAIHNSQRAKRSDPIATAEDFMPKTFAESDEQAERDEALDGPGDGGFAALRALQDSVTRRTA